MSIEYRCPQCQKLLRVQDESAGAQAKCPQCGAISTVPSEGGESEGGLGGEAAGGEMGAAESSPFGGDVQNPYASPQAGYETLGEKAALSDEIVPTSVEPGQVLSVAWESWKANIGLLAGVTVIVFGINIGLSAAQTGVELVFQQQGDDGEIIGALLGFVISIVNNFVQVFLGIGQAHIVLKLLRGQPAEIGDLFGGGPLFLRVLGASILAGFALLLGFVACIIPGIVLLVIFWPFYWLIVDERATAIESFSMASPIGKANVGTSILLWLASTGIMLVGALACLIGIIFAAPLVSMIWGTAYLMMSGQLRTGPATA